MGTKKPSLNVVLTPWDLLNLDRGIVACGALLKGMQSMTVCTRNRTSQHKKTPLKK